MKQTKKFVPAAAEASKIIHATAKIPKEFEEFHKAQLENLYFTAI
jgi:hypothetical protein